MMPDLAFETGGFPWLIILPVIKDVPAQFWFGAGFKMPVLISLWQKNAIRAFLNQRPVGLVFNWLY